MTETHLFKDQTDLDRWDKDQEDLDSFSQNQKGGENLDKEIPEKFLDDKGEFDADEFVEDFNKGVDSLKAEKVDLKP